jgi:hypothetical protein
MCPKQPMLLELKLGPIDWFRQVFKTIVTRNLGAKYDRKLILFEQHFVELFRNGLFE